MDNFAIEKPIKGSSVGGGGQVGFNFYWAHYTVNFQPGGVYVPPVDKRVKSADSSRAASGTVELRVDQAAAGGSWVSLGRYQVSRSSGAKLEVQADGQVRGPVVLADAVKWAPVR